MYTDNSNIVDIFNSLCSLLAYNHILKSSVDIRIVTDHQLWGLHVPGKNNIIADAISWLHIAEAIAIWPDLHLEYFQPPQVLLGAAKKWLHPTSWPGNPTGKSGHLRIYIMNVQLLLDNLLMLAHGIATALH